MKHERERHATSSALGERLIALPDDKFFRKRHMKKVIDANYFEHQHLDAYFRTNGENRAILIDYAGMEMRKGTDSMKNLSRSLSIFSKYPKQIVVLKGTRMLAGINTATQGLCVRLVDKDQTRGFAEFCHHVKLATIGDKRYIAEIEASAIEAHTHFSHMELGLTNIRDVLVSYITRFGEERLTELREKKQYSHELYETIEQHIGEIWAELHHMHPNIRQLRHREEMVNNIVFRYTVAGYAWLLERLRNGISDKQILSTKKVTNDFIDIVYVAYATYFDGVLSKETRVQQNFNETLTLLKKMEPKALFGGIQCGSSRVST